MEIARKTRLAVITGFSFVLVFFGLFTGRVNLHFYGEQVLQIFPLYAHFAEIGQILCLFSIGIFSYYKPLAAEKSVPYLALVLLVSGYAAALYQASGGVTHPAFIALAGLLFGGGQGACYACWIMILSRMKFEEALKCTVVSTVLSGIILSVIGFMPNTHALFGMLLLIVVGCVVLIFVCLIRIAAPHTDKREQNSSKDTTQYRRSLRSWLFNESRSPLYLFAIAFVFGVQRVISLDGYLPQLAVQILFPIGCIVGAIIFKACLKVFESDKSRTVIYSTLLIIMATSGLLSTVQNVEVQAILYGIGNIAFTVVSMCIVATVLKALLAVRLSPLFVAGFTCGAMYFSVQLGRIVCDLVLCTTALDETGLYTVSVVIIYVIAIVAIFASGIFRRPSAQENFAGETNESIGVPTEQSIMKIISVVNVTENQLRENPVYQQQFGLTKREVDMAVLLLAGYNATNIAETLFISVNTVKTHLRNLYAKMGVHNRNELIKVLNQIERSTIVDSEGEGQQ